jgi:hypothetical protein
MILLIKDWGKYALPTCGLVNLQVTYLWFRK